MPVTKDDLLAQLAQMGFETMTIEHPPLYTVEESRNLRGSIEGAHTKNLFLKDKKSRIYLVVAREETQVDLKRLHARIGASGRLSFADAARMQDLLGVKPGSVTAFGVINDQAGEVTLVLDEALIAHDMVNCHPLVNTATTTIATADLLAFLKSTGHEPLIVRLDGSDDEKNGQAQ